MAGRDLPGLGLKGDWALGEDGWKDENDLNLLKLSVLTQGSFQDKLAAEPGAPAEGDIVLLDETHATHPNEIAVYDEGVWNYILPRDGMLLYNETAGYYEKFDATAGAWAELETGGGGGGGAGTVPATFKTARAYRNGAWNTGAANGWRIYPMDTVHVDPDGWWDAANGGFRPPAGTYLVTHRVRANAVAFLGTSYAINNAAVRADGIDPDPTRPIVGQIGSAIVTVNGSQTIQAAAWNGSTANVTGTTGLYDTWLEVTKVEATVATPEFKGALLKNTADVVGLNYSTAGSIPFAAETYDYGGWHDNAVNNSRLVVPAGVTKVRLSAGIQLKQVAANADVYVNFAKNGLSFDGYMGSLADSSVSDPRINLVSAIIDVVPGDYFELRLFIVGDTSVDLNYGGTWFGIEAVQGYAATPTEGTAFPPAPVDGQRFFRTDHKVDCVYIAAATAWFTTQVFTQQIGGDDSNSYTASAGVGRFLNANHGKFGSGDAYIMRARFLCFMTGVGNWSIQLQDASGAAIANQVFAATGTANVDVNAVSANMSHGYVGLTENSGTASVLVTVAVSYRLKVV